MVAYSFFETDTRIMMYVNALRSRGDEVDIISLRHPGQPMASVLNGANVYRIQERVYGEKGRLSYLFQLLRFFCRSSFELEKRHLQNPYDIIHVHSVPDFEVFAAWYPRLKGARVILDIHDLLPEFYAAKFEAQRESLLFRMLTLVEKTSARYADHVIVANHLWEKTIRRSVNGEKCSVFLNCPDPCLFRPRDKVGNNGRFIMMYPGTLNWHQGLDIAIRAFDRIKDQIPHGEFHIYGIGGAQKSLEDLIKERRLQNRVLMKGFLPTKEVAKYMAEADLGIVPKRNDSFGGEAFSTKTLEFMSLGVPVIVSATKIDKYYFNDRVVQFFEPENEADLADKMLNLARDEELRNRLASNASKFLKDYNWENKKHFYLNLVDSLVQKK
jgi:glycosyltransferase involved in cell wall biosynthesis